MANPQQQTLPEPAAHPTPPSSSTEGFFQTRPVLQNLAHGDGAFRRIFDCYLPQPVRNAITPDLSRFGDLVHEPAILAWTADADRNAPYLRLFDTWGRPDSTLITSEGWRNLQEVGIKEGIVAIAFENEFGAYSRLYQFLKYHLWTPTSALVTCPSAMQDGAARLLALQLVRMDVKLDDVERQVLERAYKHLTSRDPEQAWTSGQWMTERTGGSDVRGTETQATYAPQFGEKTSTKDIDGLPLGPWVLNGFKWFSSATDSQMTIALAKTPSGALSTFFVPMRRQAISPRTGISNELNGISIQRLKSKLGTRAVPTAELVLKDTRAYLLGPQSHGVKNIATILNITRLHNTISAVGYWGAGLAVARAFTRVRKANGKLLIDTPSHMRTLAQEHVHYRAIMHLSYFCVALLGISETSTASYTTLHAPHKIRESNSASAAAAKLGIDIPTATVLLRLFTPVAKAVPARAVIAGLQECMECLGGVGYCENEEVEFNIARMYRDANVISIWEGTTNVIAYDLVRVLKSPRDGAKTLETVDVWLERSLTGWDSEEWKVRATVIQGIWDEMKAEVARTSVEELLFKGRELMWELSWVVMAVLLGIDVRRDLDPVAEEVCRRWFLRKADKGGWIEKRDWKTDMVWDRRIVFGDEDGMDKAKL
ncbi:aidB protein [Delitschia confertaspora ATCC 74209]|uniref:AidB protein n=1 Tax=Delitschia confertaspora ATCC 74209 TaxID=1513339 RepID=A0A9P4JFC4_9PLEO|nr:aidB protein [Delitschia confertaspora ATCC 74209]